MLIKTIDEKIMITVINNLALKSYTILVSMPLIYAHRHYVMYELFDFILKHYVPVQSNF